MLGPHTSSGPALDSIVDAAVGALPSSSLPEKSASPKRGQASYVAAFWACQNRQFATKHNAQSIAFHRNISSTLLLFCPILRYLSGCAIVNVTIFVNADFTKLFFPPCHHVLGWARHPHPHVYTEITSYAHRFQMWASCVEHHLVPEVKDGHSFFLKHLCPRQMCRDHYRHSAHQKKDISPVDPCWPSHPSLQRPPQPRPTQIPTQTGLRPLAPRPPLGSSLSCSSSSRYRRWRSRTVMGVLAPGETGGGVQTFT